MEQKLLEIEDLKYLEKDLSREELVSLVFLLYCSTDETNFALTSLLNKNSDILVKFASSTAKWKSKIVEALVVMRLFEVIKNLGISREEARLHAKEPTLINPIVRSLYEFCESCPKEVAKKLISEINEKCPDSRDIQERKLEFYLLKCLVSGTIKLNPVDLSLISNFCNEHVDCERIKKILMKFPPNTKVLDTVSAINLRINNVLNPRSSRKVNGNNLGYYKTNKM